MALSHHFSSNSPLPCPVFSPEPRPVSSVDTLSETSLQKVIFSPDGKITPGTIYLTDFKKNIMVALTCPIGNISYIRKYQYDNNTWKQLS